MPGGQTIGVSWCTHRDGPRADEGEMEYRDAIKTNLVPLEGRNRCSGLSHHFPIPHATISTLPDDKSLFSLTPPGAQIRSKSHPINNPIALWLSWLARGAVTILRNNSEVHGSSPCGAGVVFLRSSHLFSGDASRPPNSAKAVHTALGSRLNDGLAACAPPSTTVRLETLAPAMHASNQLHD